MHIGYARVSTEDQTTNLQRDALTAAGCKVVEQDEGISGVALRRPALSKVLKRLRKGDVLTVWKLDRLGRSLPDLISTVRDIEARGAHFRSLTEAIDTTTPSGRLVFHLMGALAEFERSLLIERTRAGISAARRRGQRLGRKPILTRAQVTHAVDRIRAGDGVGATARLFGVSDDTLRRAIRRSDTSP
jgi:DNA invertase Pin-like site-specific DNA recombinase